jgi:hypothetical protein
MQLALKVLAMYSLLKLPLILSVFVFLFGLWVSLVLLITQFGISWECNSSDFGWVLCRTYSILGCTSSVMMQVKKDNTAPQKPKKPPQPWTLMEELQLSNLLLRDRKKGIVVPHSKQDNYWEKRIKELPFMEKYDKDAQIVRMHEKVRRMRERYEVLANRIKIGEENVWKNNKEESLYRIWQGIWASPEKV